MKKVIIAGAASVALAAMPVVGVFAIGTDDTDVTDTIQVTVEASCTFRAEGNGTLDATYSATDINGAPVSPSVSGGTNVHTFNVFCNNNAGYSVSATAHDLIATGTHNPAISDRFTYKNALSSTAGSQGEWHATFTAVSPNVTAGQLPSNTGGTGASTATGVVATGAGSTATAGDEWTATYTALIGTDTKAATYSGTIEYTLTGGTETPAQQGN